jgi:Nucleotide-diphospho-sugar transferase
MQVLFTVLSLKIEAHVEFRCTYKIMRGAVCSFFFVVFLVSHQSAVALRDLSSSSFRTKDHESHTDQLNTDEKNDHTRRLIVFLDKISINKSVLMTFGDSISASDHQQFGVLDSWVTSVKKAKIPNAFIAAYDDATITWALQRNFPAFLMPFPTNLGAATSWIAAAKMDAIRDVLLLRFNVFFSDADILFFENPFPYLDGSFLCETQSDGYGGDNVAWHGSSRTIPNTLIHFHLLPQLNFGLSYVRGTRSVARTFNHLGRMVREEPIWDQEAYSQAMLLPSTSEFSWRGRNSVRLLEPTVFPTTCQIKNLFSKENLREMHPVAIHFNCNPPNRSKVMENVWRKYEQGEEYWSEILSTTYDAKIKQ